MEVPEEAAPPPGEDEAGLTTLYTGQFAGLTAQLLGEPETDTATILELLRKDGTVFQTFDLSAFDGIMADRGLTWDDLNGDGFPDFYGVKWTGANNWSYACWLQDPETERYQYSEELSALPSPTFFWRGVTANQHGGAAWNWTSLYQWEDGELVETRRMEPFQDVEGGEPGYTYSERLNGELTMLRRWDNWYEEEAEIELYRQKLFFPERNEAASAGGSRAFLAVAEQGEWTEDGTCDWTVTLYDTADLTTPIQKIEDTIGWLTDSVRWQDANFDGYPDFSYTTSTTVRNDYDAWWLWNPVKKRFEKSEVLSALSDVAVDKESCQITSWNEKTMQEYTCEVYDWQKDTLVCLRRLETQMTKTPDGLTTTYYERRHGELEPVRVWEYTAREPEPEEVTWYRNVLFLGEREETAVLLKGMGDRTLYVTGEWEGESGDVRVCIRVYDTADLMAPIQEMWDEVSVRWESLYVEDYNFDGYWDFYYPNVVWAGGGDCHYWLWNPETEQFEVDNSLRELPMLRFDSEQKAVRELRNGAGGDTYIFYCWEGKELVPVRTAGDELDVETWQREFTVTDHIGGKEIVVYHNLWMDAKDRKEGETDLEYCRYFDLDYKG